MVFVGMSRIAELPITLLQSYCCSRTRGMMEKRRISGAVEVRNTASRRRGISARLSATVCAELHLRLTLISLAPRLL